MTTPVHYCTYFDHRYLSRGLALYASMIRHCGSFRLFVLCLTEECYGILSALALPHVVPLRLDELESHDRELLAVKHQRSVIEYYFTCTPAFIKWLLQRDPSIGVLTYLDADLYFYRSPNFLLDEFENHSTLIVPHNFVKRNEQQEQFGIYNVGWMCFRADADGFACLDWWRRSCLEWCRDFAENGRYGDQKYLDYFPSKFARVQIVRHPGVNLAPWNIENYRFSIGPGGEPRVNDLPVIFFHFHGLRRVNRFLWYTHHTYGAPLTRRIRLSLYAPYLAELAAAEELVRPLLPAFTVPLQRAGVRVGLKLLGSKLREATNSIIQGGGIWILGRRAKALPSVTLIGSIRSGIESRRTAIPPGPFDIAPDSPP